jgi:hypothetical protein
MPLPDLYGNFTQKCQLFVKETASLAEVKSTGKKLR